MAEETLKEKTAKGLFWGGISNGVQQILGVIIGIVLLKYLSPDDYGMVGLLAIFMGIASTIQESGFTAALVNRPEYKAEDYNSVFWFNLITGSIIYIILFFSAPLIAKFFNEPDLILLSRILFLSIIIGSFSIAQNAVLLKKLMVKEKAKIDIISILISGIIGISLAIYKYGYWALIAQTLSTNLISTILKWVYSPWRPDLKIKYSPIKEMMSFGIRMLFSSIISQIHGNIFSVLLGKYYSKIEVGYFYQGTKWSGMGGQVITGMLNSIIQPVLVKTRNDKEKETKVFRKLLRFTAFVSFPLLLGLGFVGEDFILLINKDWLPCIPILRLYCIWGAIMPLTILYSQILISNNRSDLFLKCTLYYAIYQIFISLFSIEFGMYYFALSLTISSILYLFFWHYITNKIISIRLTDIIMDIFPYIFISLISFVVSWMVSINITILSIKIITKIVISIITYVSILYISGSKIFSDSLEFIKTRI